MAENPKIFTVANIFSINPSFIARCQLLQYHILSNQPNLFFIIIPFKYALVLCRALYFLLSKFLKFIARVITIRRKKNSETGHRKNIKKREKNILYRDFPFCLSVYFLFFFFPPLFIYPNDRCGKMYIYTTIRVFFRVYSCQKKKK